jgi:hypothetical protein
VKVGESWIWGKPLGKISETLSQKQNKNKRNKRTGGRTQVWSPGFSLPYHQKELSSLVVHSPHHSLLYYTLIYDPLWLHCHLSVCWNYSKYIRTPVSVTYRSEPIPVSSLILGTGTVRYLTDRLYVYKNCAGFTCHL